LANWLCDSQLQPCKALRRGLDARTWSRRCSIPSAAVGQGPVADWSRSREGSLPERRVGPSDDPPDHDQAAFGLEKQKEPLDLKFSPLIGLLAATTILSQIVVLRF
jgi:hypothetical protein